MIVCISNCDCLWCFFSWLSSTVHRHCVNSSYVRRRHW